MSTEDGRILLYSAHHTYIEELHNSADIDVIPALKPIGQIMEKSKSRIKDFEILATPGFQKSAGVLYIVSASSDGAIRIFTLDTKKLLPDHIRSDSVGRKSEGTEDRENTTANTTADGSGSSAILRIGKLVGTYETGHRITCLRAFMMLDSSVATPKHICEAPRRQSHSRR